MKGRELIPFLPFLDNWPWTEVFISKRDEGDKHFRHISLQSFCLTQRQRFILH